MADITCENCGERVFFRGSSQPLAYVEREARGGLPRSFLIIGGEVLLHQCVIVEDGLNDDSLPLQLAPVVHQASGMVSVQAECTVDEAFTMLYERALVSGQSVKDIAVAVVERTIRLDE